MPLVWDEPKRQWTIRERGIDFAALGPLFELPTVEWEDTREAYAEERWIAIGILEGRVLVVAYTDVDEDTRRIISARKATRREERIYAKAYPPNR